MKPRYEKPPYQPKWLLQAQVWILRHRLLPAFNKQSMVITTTGRKTGLNRSVPIDFVRDGSTYLAINVGGNSHWYRNALANPCVTLEIDGKRFEARAEPAPVNTPEQLQRMLDVYRRERPRMFENFLQISLDVPVEEMMNIGKYVAFVRFYPLN
jgi:deazaflavin-dependent oxidoreductase (nitroreductase family)